MTPPPPEPEPEVTVVNHSYLLKGLFAGTANSWAIVEDGGGEYLLRVGDDLPGGFNTARQVNIKDSA